MIQWRDWFPRLAAILRDRAERRDVDRELRSHLEMRIQDNIDSGMTPSEARVEAYNRFGNFLRTETVCLEIRKARKENIMEALLHDIQYGCRVLRKNPGVTIIAVITLALGIGANSSIFSIVDTVLLRPLPYLAPDRLVQFWETNPKHGWTEATVAPANFLDWQKQSQSFQEMGAYWGSDGRGATLSNFALTGNGEAERIQGLGVTGNIFSVLGVSPLLGRTFTPEETWVGKNRVVVLSHTLWQTRFGGNPDIIGKQIALNGNNYTVLGVMPADFLLPTKEVQLWAPMGWDPNSIAQWRVPHYLRVVGRLKPGVTLDQARQEMAAIASRLGEQYPDTNKQMGVGLGPMLDWDVASTRKPLYIFLGAVAFVLLIACTNVANLLLARATARKKEFALRAALGAGRGRLIRQLLTESLVLSGLGGALGLFLAVVCNNLLVSFSPGNIPRFDDIKLDARVVLFTFGLTVITSVIFGLLPAVSGSKTDLNESLKDGGQKGGRGMREKGVQGFLVVSEIALSLILIIGAGLMIKSFLRLQQVDPGFDAKNLLTFQLALPEAKYSQDQQVINFYQQAMDRIKGLPGVNSVAMTTRLPLMGYHWTSDFVIEGRPIEDFTEARHKDVTPDYFRTMHIPVLKGRAFNDADTMNSPHVIIINETLARRCFGNDDPVGTRIKFDDTDRDRNWLTIVGVAGDEKQDGMTAEVKPEVFQPWAQFARENMVLAIRTNGDPRNSITAIREQIRAVDPELPAFNIRTMEDIISVSVARQRFAMLLLTIFAVIALVLASVGIYGVMSYATAQRTNEIGIRMALGARPGDVMKLVLGQGLKFVIAGLVIGLIGSALLTNLMMSLLFDVSATDPVTFLSVSLLLSMVALIACYIPARRAISVDPISALNHE